MCCSTGMSVQEGAGSGTIGKRLQGHPLKSFSVPAPPPQSAPSTPQQKHVGEYLAHVNLFLLSRENSRNDLVLFFSSFSDCSASGVQSIQEGRYPSFRSCCYCKGADCNPRTLHSPHSGSSNYIRRCQQNAGEILATFYMKLISLSLPSRNQIIYKMYTAFH